MTHSALTYVRALFAFTVGVGIDLVLSADAYAYGDRFHHQNLIGINVFWLMLVLPFLCSFALEFKWRHQGGESPTLAAFDSRGLLIPSAIVIGLTVTHTIVLIRDMMIDPTTHNLAPFEYLFAWVTVGIPALTGSMLARATCWMVNRLRVQ
jgi:hypothetical protein